MTIKQQIQVMVDPDDKTLKFIDNGIGMTGDEVEEYITRSLFPVQQNSWRNTKTRQQMTRSSVISDWDFYSAFMVADEVHIDTLSYKDGATAVHWTCDGGTEYDMQEGNKNRHRYRDHPVLE